MPLLEFTLLKLWEHRQHNYITWEAFQRLGGGRLALANSADAFYQSLIPEEQMTARRILLRMVRASDGLDMASPAAACGPTGTAPAKRRIASTGCWTS